MPLSKIPVIANSSTALDLNDDTYIANNLSANIVYTLPLITNFDGANFYIIRADTTNFTLTVNPTGPNTISGGPISVSGRSRIRLISAGGVWYGTSSDSSTQEQLCWNSGGNVNNTQVFIGPSGQFSTPIGSSRCMTRGVTVLSERGVISSIPSAGGSIVVDLLNYVGSNFGSVPVIIGTVTLDNTSPVSGQFSLTINNPSVAQFDSIVLRFSRIGTATSTNQRTITLSADII